MATAVPTASSDPPALDEPPRFTSSIINQGCNCSTIPKWTHLQCLSTCLPYNGLVDCWWLFNSLRHDADYMALFHENVWWKERKAATARTVKYLNNGNFHLTSFPNMCCISSSAIFPPIMLNISTRAKSEKLRFVFLIFKFRCKKSK